MPFDRYLVPLLTASTLCSLCVTSKLPSWMNQRASVLDLVTCRDEVTLQCPSIYQKCSQELTVAITNVRMGKVPFGATVWSVHSGLL